MKRIYNKLFSVGSKGFTLIELLVVIGILGILASALIATIDPFEQLKKATDANVKNALVEYLNANVRYYTTHNTFPWDTVANGGDNCNGGVAPDGSGTTGINTPSTMTTCTDALIAEKELKSGFSTATNLLKEIYITYDASNNDLTGCFKPGSASQQKDKNTKFTQTGTDGTDCKSAGGATSCYWCTK